MSFDDDFQGLRLLIRLNVTILEKYVYRNFLLFEGIELGVLNRFKTNKLNGLRQLARQRNVFSALVKEM